jgi:hypothetical protein
MKQRTMMLMGALISSILLSAQTTDSNHNTITTPVRLGLLPGLGTPGKNDVRTTSRFSFNLLGGATGSVNGVEVSGLFNIDKGSVQYVQVSGLFNTIKGSFKGTQVAGISNYVKGAVNGIQVGGINNHTSGKLTGVQTAGISNYARESLQGIQVAGISNISSKGIAGIQVAGIINYARHLKGVQVGLINIADSSDGISIGLINIVPKGYHKISVSANEVLSFNVAFKTGNARLYNMLLGGINPGNNNKAFSYGYGLGTELKMGKRVTINPEVTCQYLYLGNSHSTNLLNKLSLQANLPLTKGFTLFAGPSFAAYYSDQIMQVTGYKFQLPRHYHGFDLGDDNVTGWIGWSAGITFF